MAEASRFRPTGQADLAPPGQAERARANLAALTVLRQVQAAGREATATEQQVLARWSGWGALPLVFDGRPARAGFDSDTAHQRAVGRWQSLGEVRDQVRALLTDAEWNAARRNTLNAHYTDAAFVTQIWDAVREMGFDGGTVLEPGSGVGNFIGLAPEVTHPVRMTGVELDPTTAAISQLLYPDATIVTGALEDVTLPRNAFDAAVGNVPFGRYQPYDADYNRDRTLSIHDLFAVKALASVRPGGVVALITSRFCLDAADPAARERLYELGDLVGAVRLPATAHRAAAGTDVVTDVVFLRRRTENEPPGDDTWLGSVERVLDGRPEPVRVNAYYAAHPEHVLGELQTRLGPFGPELTVTSTDDTREIAARLGAAARAIALQTPRDQSHDQGAAGQPGAAAVVPLQGAEGALALTPSGDLTIIDGGRPVPLEVHPEQRDRLVQLVALKQQVQSLYEAEAATTAPGETSELAELRRQVRQTYQDYRRRYPPLSKPRQARTFTPQEARERAEREGLDRVPDAWRQPTAFGLIDDDPDAALLFSLEVWNEQTGEPVEQPILSRRMLQPRMLPEHADGVEEAIALAMEHDGGALHMERVAALLGVEAEEAVTRVGHLAFRDPERGGAWEPRHRYLSGDVRTKLAAARSAAATDPSYAANVAALEQVQPTDLTPSEIKAKVGATWIPVADYTRFLRELGFADAKVLHARGTLWEVQGADVGDLATFEWGTPARSAQDLFEALLAQAESTIRITYRDTEGNTRVDQEATAAAREKAKLLAQEFEDWVWRDPQRAERLAHTYNETFNRLVLPEYDASALTLPGAVLPWPLRPHQNAAVRRIITSPTVLLAHVVGAGKTATMVAGAMELRRTGIARKPAMVVPNHMLKQFTREFRQLYPSAKLLAINASDLHHGRRTKFMARIAGGEWDAVILTHEAFNRVPVRPSTEAAYLDTELEVIRDQLETAKAVGMTNRTLKQIENVLANAEGRIKEQLDKTSEDGVFFEDTGIDYLFLDEAHEYKNLRTVSAIPGATIQGSNKATKLHMVLQHLRSESGTGRVATLATGTPIANSVTEAYILQRYMDADLLASMGLENFDNWAATFGEVVTAIEPDPKGAGYRQKSRFARFFNVPEFMRAYRSFADVQMAEDLKLPTPPVRSDIDGQRGEVVVVPSTGAQRAYLKSLPQQPWINDEGGVLKALGLGLRASVDMRLVGGSEEQGSKLDHVADQAAQIWAEHKDVRYPVSFTDPTLQELPGALQLVFLDEGTPGSASQNPIDLYADLRDKLVERGLPRGGIRFIHEANNDAKKDKLFADARAGRVSVLIGSTQKMGTGTNVQDRAVALHHVSYPWRPADMAQRDGRIERQGNLNDPRIPGTPDEVRTLYYVTERTFDEFRLNTLTRKAKFIGQLQRRDLSVREVEDISAEAVNLGLLTALSSGDPTIMEHAQATAERARLQGLARGWDREQDRRTRQVTEINGFLARATTALYQMRTAAATRTPTAGDAFTITLNGVGYTKRDLAATALGRILNDLARDTTQPAGQPIPLGSLGGQAFHAEITYGFQGARMVRLRFTWGHVVTPGHRSDRAQWRASEINPGAGRGALQALENFLTHLDSDIVRLDAAVQQQRQHRAEIGVNVRDKSANPYRDLARSKEREEQLLGQLIIANEKEANLAERAEALGDQEFPESLADELADARAAVARLHQDLADEREQQHLLSEREAPAHAALPGGQTTDARPTIADEAGPTGEPSTEPGPAADPTVALPDEAPAPSPDEVSTQAPDLPGVDGPPAALPLFEPAEPEPDPGAPDPLAPQESTRPQTVSGAEQDDHAYETGGSDDSSVAPARPDEPAEATPVPSSGSGGQPAVRPRQEPLPEPPSQPEEDIPAPRSDDQAPNARSALRPAPPATAPPAPGEVPRLDEPARRRRPDWSSEPGMRSTRADRGVLARLAAVLDTAPDPYTAEVDNHDPAKLSREIVTVALDRVTGTGTTDLHRDDVAAHTVVFEQLGDALERRDEEELRELVASNPRHADALYLSYSPQGTVALTGLVYSWDIVIYDAIGTEIDKIDDDHFESWMAAEETAQLLLDAHPQGATAQIITGNGRYVVDVEPPAPVEAPPAESPPQQVQLFTQDMPIEPQATSALGDAPHVEDQMPPEPTAVAEAPTGPWSARIQIDDTAARPTVAGTRYEDEQLREALRANGFRWRRGRQLWEYAGPAAAKDAAARAIADLVAELDQARPAPGEGKRSFPPTAQQQAIIDAALAGHNVAVQALAGTGKTSTLRMVADAMPGKSITYIAFNKSIAREAQSAFGTNVQARTAHALALRSLRSGPHADKLNHVGKGARHPGEIAEVLRLAPVGFVDPEDGQPKSMQPSELAQLAMATVRKFRESADPQISGTHLPDALILYPGTQGAVLDAARRAWDNIADPGNSTMLDQDRPGAILFDHDDYLKLWALSRPRIDADVIFFDEAQDINDVLRQVVQDQPTQTIVVGDTYQSIYGFRGARDALVDWPADITLPLTRSWRFGPAVAAVGDDFLRLLKAPYELEGNPALDSAISVVDDPDAVLCRTNVGAVSAVFDAFDKGKRAALVGGGNAIKDLARAAKDLQAGRGTKHPELSRFTTWGELQAAAEDERALQTFVRLIDQHHPDELLRMVDRLISEDATGADAPDVVVSTAHKAKGREWDNVAIAGDFYGPTYDQSGRIEALPPAEELRLSYVAVTRGRARVSLGSLAWIEDVRGTGHNLAGSEVETSVQTTADVAAGAAADPAPESAPTLAAQPDIEPAQLNLLEVEPQQSTARAAGTSAQEQGDQPRTFPRQTTPSVPAGEPAEPTVAFFPYRPYEPPAAAPPEDASEQPDELIRRGRGAQVAPDQPSALPQQTVAEPTTPGPAQQPAATAAQTSPDDISQVPPQPTDPPHDMLDRMFADAAASLAEPPGGDPAADADEPRPAPVYDYPYLTGAFEQVKHHLGSTAPHEDVIDGILAGERATTWDRPTSAEPAASAPAVRTPPGGASQPPIAIEEALAEPLEAARTALADHTDAPEWQRITAVIDASRHLGDTIKTSAGSYAREVLADLRIQGLRRMIAVRCARTVASAAYGLASRLERGATRAVRALRNLARKARDHADQLSGALPPGRTLQTMSELQEGWTALDQRLGTPKQGTQSNALHATAWPAALLTSSVDRLHTAYTTAAAALGDRITDTPAWQRIAALWNSASAVLSKVNQGVLRFEDDAATLGFFSAVWARTVETVSWGARQAMEHLDDKGAHGGIGWHALRLLRHTSEETLAHLRGQLPRDRHAPMGTYDPPLKATAADLDTLHNAASSTPAADTELRHPGARDTATVVAELIPVLDAIDEALEHGDPVSRFAQVAMLAERAADRLGLTRFGAAGEDFDPARHDAVAFNGNQNGAPPEHPVTAEVLRPGYAANGKVVRPASVVVTESTTDTSPDSEATFISAISGQLTRNTQSRHTSVPATTSTGTASSPAPPRGTTSPKAPDTER